MDDHPFLEPATVRSTDGLPVRTATAELIDLERVATHIEQARTRGRYEGSDDPREYLFQRQCLVQVGAEIYATLAGLLCFGRYPRAMFPQAVVDIGHFRGTETLSFEVVHLEKNIGGSIFDQLGRVEEYIRRNTHHGMTLAESSLQRVEIHEYPPAVVRELIVNMLAHRDYANFMAVARVQVFSDRIEWISPGGLPPGITIENLLSSQMSRNPNILTILYEAGYVEAFGQGLDTVVSVLRREGMKPPRFEDTRANFIVTVYGRSIDVVAQSRMATKLSTSQRKILEFVDAKGQATPAEIAEMLTGRSQRSRQRDIETLLNSGLLRSEGGGRTLRYLLGDPAS